MSSDSSTIDGHQADIWQSDISRAIEPQIGSISIVRGHWEELLLDAEKPVTVSFKDRKEPQFCQTEKSNPFITRMVLQRPKLQMGWKCSFTESVLSRALVTHGLHLSGQRIVVQPSPFKDWPLLKDGNLFLTSE